MEAKEKGEGRGKGGGSQTQKQCGFGASVDGGMMESVGVYVRASFFFLSTKAKTKKTWEKIRDLSFSLLALVSP